MCPVATLNTAAKAATRVLDWGCVSILADQQHTVKEKMVGLAHCWNVGYSSSHAGEQAVRPVQPLGCLSDTKATCRICNRIRTVPRLHHLRNIHGRLLDTTESTRRNAQTKTIRSNHMGVDSRNNLPHRSSLLAHQRTGIPRQTPFGGHHCFPELGERLKP